MLVPSFQEYIPIHVWLHLVSNAFKDNGSHSHVDVYSGLPSKHYLVSCNNLGIK